MNSSPEQGHAAEMSEEWHTSKLTIADRAKHLLLTGLYTDCQFLVGGFDGSQPELIKAHQFILRMSSPVFDTMFFGKLAGAVANEAIISLTDLAPSSFEDLLQYIYTDSVDLSSVEQAMGLCYAAKKYLLPGLVAKCLQYLQDNLCPEHVCRVLAFSNLFDDENLKAKCLSVVQEHTTKSLATSDFEELSASLVLLVVKEDTLNIISELQLFDAVVRWAGYQCAQEELEVNGGNMRQMLGDEIVAGIRFLAMKPEEFASLPALSGILTDNECTAILVNISNPSGLPMPLHLSSCRNQRRAFSSRRENGGRSTVNDGIYCLRMVQNGALRLKNQFVHEMNTSFVVDQAIIFKGVVLTGIVLADQLGFTSKDILLDCRLLDHFDVVLASARLSQTIPCQATPIILEPEFNCVVRLERNCRYRIRVSFNRSAHYLSGMAHVVSCEGVKFIFNNDIFDDLVSGIIFNLC